MDKQYFMKSDLAARWGVKRQTVNNWAHRHSDFPEPAFTLGNDHIPVYQIDAVERYESRRGLKQEVKKG